MIRTATLLGLCLALIACSDTSDPFADDTGSPDTTSTDDTGGDVPTDDTGDDSGGDTTGDPGGGGDPTCLTTPTRYIVLGDSINACSTIGGKQDSRCAPKIFHEFMDTGFAPAAEYENYAVGGAVTQSVVSSQLGRIPVGQPGHVLLNIFIGGNDLQPYIFISDKAAEDKFAVDKPRLLGLWDEIFAFLETPSNFPDGITVMMNTQYNPFDDCTAPPYNLSEYKISLLNEFNDELRRLAAERDYVYMTDQHKTFLGHGHHYQVETCPYYQPGLEGWMGDLIHPNEPGHAHLAAEWQLTSNLMYGGCQ